MISVSLTDAPTAAIVVGGTLLATFLRCGPGECAAALRALFGGWGTPGFDADGVRAQLAVQMREIERDGLLRARQRGIDDDEFDEAIAALFSQRSLEAAIAVHETHRARRRAARARGPHPSQQDYTCRRFDHGGAFGVGLCLLCRTYDTNPVLSQSGAGWTFNQVLSG